MSTDLTSQLGVMSADADVTLSADGPQNRPTALVWSEYRMVTVAFVDINGSVNLLKRVGPEVYQSRLMQFQARLLDVLSRFDGKAHQMLGDGVLCLFPHGLKQPHAALRAVAAMLTFAREDRAGEEPDFSIGMATGRALFRDAGPEGDPLAVGDCINLAARLLDRTQERDFIICERTQSLVQKHVATQALGRLDTAEFNRFDGFYRIGFDAPTPSRRLWNGGKATPVAQLVGRDSQLEQLKYGVQIATSGQITSFTIQGPAGIGKTRLVQALCAHVERENGVVVKLQCRKEEAARDFDPVFSYLRRISGIGGNDTPERGIQKLSRLFGTVWGLAPADVSRMLSLMGYDVAGESAANLNASRAWVCATLCRITRAMLRHQPMLLLVVEDVHWIDPSTDAFLAMLQAETRAASVMIVTSARDRKGGHRPRFIADRRLRLEPLARTEAVHMIQHHLGAGRLAPRTLDWICELTAGNPLFLTLFCEHLMRTTAPIPADIKDMPGVEGLFEARLDRLPKTARRFIQTASVLGPRFDPQIVAQTLGYDDAGMIQSLDICAAENLLEEPFGEFEVGFVHEVVQRMIYDNLSGELQRNLHAQVAEVLAINAAQPELIARQLIAAGQYEKALAPLQRALAEKFQIGAQYEARQILADAYCCLDTLPASRSRLAYELSFRSVEAPLEMVTGGPGSVQFGAALDRALRAAHQLEPPQNTTALTYNLGLHKWAIGQLGPAAKVAQEVLQMRQGGDDVILAGNTLSGLVAWHRGKTQEALAHLDQVAVRYNVTKHAQLYPRFLKDFGVFSNFYAALSHAVLGQGELADQHAKTSLDIAQQLNIPHAIGFGYLARCLTAFLQGDLITAGHFGLKAEALSEDHGFPEFLAMARLILGYVATHSATERGRGVDKMQSAFSDLKQTSFVCWQGFYAVLVAERLIDAGQLEIAEPLIYEHLHRCTEMSEAQFVPLLHLVQAKLHHAFGRDDQASRTLAQGREAAEGSVLWGRLFLAYDADPARPMFRTP